ncbi:hypothetical protein SERLA73DRAFT_150265 [Serpula lacrymans var. lacrymans S7.3]|uniref:Myb/SANT-like domain-containing protein n=1 Tax=Serpula lacrymans var. lacrymans (strain S7.3) TaxID=936435 RepID=F8PLT7_SERL3|nr:hypothetical protein SERLA73DRAFT_150265 [Serpula lacrymans var. lacrymans S7.3]
MQPILPQLGPEGAYISFAINNAPPAATDASDTLSSKAMWPGKDQTLLVDYIIKNWEEVCPGQTFQKDFWNNLVAHLAPHHTVGAPKTRKHCSEKCRRIKTTYKSLKGLINHGSGLIITAESKTLWNDFVKQYPLVAPFKTKGWALFNRLTPLLAGAGAQVYILEQYMGRDSASPPVV